MAVEWAEKFCSVNRVEVPEITDTLKDRWTVDSCAYYRSYHSKSRAGIVRVCTDLCQWPATDNQSRNWSWPGNTVDREPFGVVCHELGHHFDMLLSCDKRKYSGDFSSVVRRKSEELAISGYCPDDSEWFAEMFRLFLTNYGLLYQLRPKTCELLMNSLIPIGSSDWLERLGANAPERIIRSARNKGAR